MTVIKRNRNTTRDDLLEALTKLCWLLEDQKEHDAVADLREAAEKLRNSKPESSEQRAAIASIIDAFEGDHELMAYTMQREGTQWTEVEELSQASSRVISLARRMGR
jgi:hypothetical protein